MIIQRKNRKNINLPVTKASLPAKSWVISAMVAGTNRVSAKYRKKSKKSANKRVLISERLEWNGTSSRSGPTSAVRNGQHRQNLLPCTKWWMYKASGSGKIRKKSNCKVFAIAPHFGTAAEVTKSQNQNLLLAIYKTDVFGQSLASRFASLGEPHLLQFGVPGNWPPSHFKIPDFLNL